MRKEFLLSLYIRRHYSKSALINKSKFYFHYCVSGDDDGPEAKIDYELERSLLELLCEVSPNLPTNSTILGSTLNKKLNRNVSHEVLHNLLQKFAIQHLIRSVVAYEFWGETLELIEWRCLACYCMNLLFRFAFLYGISVEPQKDAKGLEITSAEYAKLQAMINDVIIASTPSDVVSKRRKSCKSVYVILYNY